METKFLGKLILLGTVCGIFIGVFAYAAQSIYLGKFESGPGQPGTSDETDSEELEEDERTDLNGSYAGINPSVELHLTEVNGPVRFIKNYGIIYIDKEKELEGTIWGHTNYFGLNGWVKMEDISLISERDYSIKPGEYCNVTTVRSDLNFSYEASDNVMLMCTVPFGSSILIEEFEENSAKTSYDGKTGWIDSENISIYRAEFPYIVKSVNGEPVAVYAEPSFEDEMCGVIKNGSVIKFEQFSQGWGEVLAGDTVVWLPFDENLCPANEKAEVTDMSAVFTPETQETKLESETKPEPETETEHYETDFYKDGTRNPTNGYILPQSNSKYLTGEDVENLTLKGICYAKNEIYARYGRKFKSKELQEYFNGQSWYRGILDASEATDSYIVSQMNEFEKKNKDFLYSTEAGYGMYSLDQ